MTRKFCIRLFFFGKKLFLVSFINYYPTSGICEFLPKKVFHIDMVVYFDQGLSIKVRFENCKVAPNDFNTLRKSRFLTNWYIFDFMSNTHQKNITIIFLQSCYGVWTSKFLARQSRFAVAKTFLYGKSKLTKKNWILKFKNKKKPKFQLIWGKNLLCFY